MSNKTHLEIKKEKACVNEIKWKIRPLLILDILIEVICFINKRHALRLASTSRVIKYFVEKLIYYPLKPRIVPELIIITMLGYKSIVNNSYNNYTYASFPGKVLRPGYYGCRVCRRLPKTPPPYELAGFEDISLEFEMTGIMRSSDFITTIRFFLNNIKHLITHKTHFLHIRFKLSDYVCSHDPRQLYTL